MVLSFHGGSRLLPSAVNTGVFAQVLVDIQVQELGDRLFSYRVPEHMRRDTFVGAQVLVPFGNQALVSGYVVSLTDTAPRDVRAKDVAEVLDGDPLFDGEYVDFLYWVADYYCASLSSVIAAAIPPNFAPRLKRMVELASSELIEPATTTNIEMREEGCKRILSILRAQNKCRLSMRTLRQRTSLAQSQFHRALGILRDAGIVTVSTGSTAYATPKTVTAILWTGEPASTVKQEIIIATLRRHGGQLPLKLLLESAGTTGATIKRMCALGMLSVVQQEVLRDPMARVNPPAAGPDAALPELTAHQEAALSVLGAELEKTLAGCAQADGKPWLLYGVTGSGKTEVYLRLIKKTVDSGRSAQLLVPEISLTPQLAERLKSRFGSQVAVWHSGLSTGERYDTWRRLRCGEVKVLLGARSAVFANMPDLGLIVLDEEHDASYKQTNPSPRYHAGRLAQEKARRVKAMVVFGSATPDVGTYHEARAQGRILELPYRVFQQAMPEVKVVDMRQEFATGNRGIFSNLLTSCLEACLGRNEQAILLMNRRGYANHVFCRACGYVVKCRSCSVSMVLHQHDNAGGEASGYLSCHHCGYSTAATCICPGCQSPFLREYGLGTQRVEHDLRKLFPGSRLLRLDADVAGKRGAYQEVFERFSRGDADILVGTQMVAKGLDIPAVTVVGVLAADAAFNLPDYRSIERGFQLLTQVSGRAGRGERPGVVILQTYNPDMPVLGWASRHDYSHFVEQELGCRRELTYPPFSQVIRIIVSGPDDVFVQAACEELTEELTHYLEDEVDEAALKILGPAPCLIERIRGKYRYHLLVKNLEGEKGRKLLSAFLRLKHSAPGLNVAVDVDAVDII